MPNPQSTDDKQFDGAAKLQIRFIDDKITLTGSYWTNRASQRGLQTSGSIELRRIEPS